MSRVVVFERDLFRSDAYLAIKSIATMRALIEFYLRRQIHKTKDRKGCRGTVVVANNGKIIFTYEEAIERLHISQATFSRTITELMKLGFIDITEYSQGFHRMPTLYAISERWRKYGTLDFVKVERKVIKPPFVRQKEKPVIIGDNCKAHTVIIGDKPEVQKIC